MASRDGLENVDGEFGVEENVLRQETGRVEQGEEEGVVGLESGLVEQRDEHVESVGSVVQETKRVGVETGVHIRDRERRQVVSKRVATEHVNELHILRQMYLKLQRVVDLDHFRTQSNRGSVAHTLFTHYVLDIPVQAHAQSALPDRVRSVTPHALLATHSQQPEVVVIILSTHQIGPIKAH